MTQTFNNINDLEAQILKDLNKIFRGSAISVFNQIVGESPVKTGRFRGNWFATVNAPSSNVIDDIDGTSGTFDASALSESGSLSDTLYLTNNLPYAQRLASGWSQQRPDGWIDVIVLQGKQGLQQVINAASGK